MSFTRCDSAWGKIVTRKSSSLRATILDNSDASKRSPKSSSTTARLSKVRTKFAIYARLHINMSSDWSRYSRTSTATTLCFRMSAVKIYLTTCLPQNLVRRLAKASLKNYSLHWVISTPRELYIVTWDSRTFWWLVRTASKSNSSTSVSQSIWMRTNAASIPTDLSSMLLPNLTKELSTINTTFGA
jgi:hypothetical protein